MLCYKFQHKTAISLRLITLLWCLSHLGQLAAQEAIGNFSQRLSYQELLTAMVTCTDSVYSLENAYIFFDPQKDSRFVFESVDAFPDTDSLTVEATVILDQIQFEAVEYRFFNKIHFQSDVVIQLTPESSVPGFSLCTFAASFNYLVSEIEGVEEGINSPVFFHCIFNGRMRVRSSAEVLYFTNCQFIEKSPTTSAAQWIVEMTNEAAQPRLDESVVRCDSCHTRFKFESSSIHALRLFDNTFETDVIIREQTIEDLTLRDNQFKGKLDLTNLDFGFQKSELTYAQLNGSVAVYQDGPELLWQPVEVADYADSVATVRFFSIYRRLTEYFRYRGNRKDYNAAFVKMKQYETSYLQFDYQQSPSLTTWFSWRMNQFLGTFSDYGTQPVKAIVYAIRVIALFAIFYFFFHNDWDRFNRRSFVERIRLLYAYFRSEEDLALVYQQQKQSTNSDTARLLEELRAYPEAAPKLFHRLVRPVYWWENLEARFTHFIFQRAEILNGSWQNLSSPKKRNATLWAGVWIGGYLIVGVLSRAINAITLSLNAFTTLGFGQIPSTGLPRYAAIIEGFIGWFLLTIFSVSLISQLLQ